MNEEELLKKLNYMYKHNQIVSLKTENQEKDEKIRKLSEDSKKIIGEFGSKNKENIDNLKERIKALEEKNMSLNQEKNYYKEMFEKIPSFIRKIFIKEKKTITE